MRAPRILRAALALGLAEAAHRVAALQLALARREVAGRPAAEPLDLLFGIRAVAPFLGLSKNQARTLVARGAIPALRSTG